MPSNPSLRHLRNLLTVPLQIAKMPVPVDPNLRQPDPLRLAARLLQILHDTVIGPRVLRRLTRERYVGHFVDVREFSSGLGLPQA